MYPTLKTSYKGRYPFKIGTTSFIYPDIYSVNVERTGNYLDEIELLFLESLPAETRELKEDIQRLGRLALELRLTYNIHLPTDVSICDPDDSRKRRALDAVKRVHDLTGSLMPSLFTLHVPFNESSTSKDAIERWRHRAHEGLQQLIRAGMQPHRLTIETLDYPLAWLQPVITALNLSVCLDIGHLIINGLSITSTFRTFAEKTLIIHLHGVKDGQDHVALGHMPPAYMKEVMDILWVFPGTVSLEIFNFNDLEMSLKTLASAWQKADDPGL
jgi:sugar phosphate isomerase/epimerase